MTKKDKDGGRTPAGTPDLEAAKRAFADLVVTIAHLRDPNGGCPWDLKQDHHSLRRFMIEEAYEAAEAMAKGAIPAIREELGDVLLQVVLNAQIANDNNAFSIADVARGINDKMRRRHPHVFGTPEEKAALTEGQVRSNWETIKADEKKGQQVPVATFFADAEGKGPATHQAHKIGKIAAKIHFDWDEPEAVFQQVRSEVDEVGEAMREKAPLADLAEEIGDIYFSLAQLCRHLNLDPEVVSLDANRKFLRRFAALEALARSRGQDVTRASKDDLEALWRDVKERE